MAIDICTNRPTRTARGSITALAAVLSCQVFFAGSMALAQERSLRGTVRAAEAQTTSPLKKKRKKAMLSTQVEAPAVPAYEPLADAGADPSDAELALEPISQPAVPIAEPNVSADLLADTEEPLAETPVIRRAAPLSSEIPTPVTRIASDGELQRDTNERAGTDNERTGAIEGLDRDADTDPFAAPGIRSGMFVLRPTVETGVRTFTNPNDPACDCFETRLETTSTIRAESDWLRHQLNVEMRGSVAKPLSNPTGSDLAPAVDNAFRLAADGRIDISVADTMRFTASAERGREALGTDSSTGYLARSPVSTLSATAGYTHDAGPIGLGISGNVVKTNYGDVIDLGGIKRDQSDRDNLNASLTLRGTYNLSPILSPFAEVEIGRRLYDNEVDALGQRNSATRYAGRLGVAFNKGEKLTGEMAGGWFTEKVDDPALADVSGIDLRGTVNWSPMRDTTVEFVASTAVEGGRSAGSPTSVVYDGTVNFTRKMRANLDANLLLGAALRDFNGLLASQTTLTVEAGATLWFNRYAGLNGKLSYSHGSGSVAGVRDTYGAYLGVILRR